MPDSFRVGIKPEGRSPEYRGFGIADNLSEEHLFGLRRRQEIASTPSSGETKVSLHTGKGFGTEAARTVLGFEFSELNLHRVSLRVLALNEPAIRSYQKCGFPIEGLERETAYLDGKWHDDLIMGVLENELRLEACRSIMALTRKKHSCSTTL